jgi:hypothetical protein
VKGNKVTVEVGFYPFDATRIRDILYKAENNYFITAQELWELEKGGARKIRD